LSPFQVFVGDFGPTVPADRKPSSLVVDVDFDVRFLAFAVPRVSAMFNHLFHEHSWCHFRKSLGFKMLGATTIHRVERAE